MTNTNHRFVALNCRLALGGFSGERVFEVPLANGDTYRSIAPRQFCWNADGKLVAEQEPQSETDGKIAARVIDQTADGQVFVEIPDGEVIAVDQQIVGDRPTEIRPPLPLPHQNLALA